MEHSAWLWGHLWVNLWGPRMVTFSLFFVSLLDGLIVFSLFDKPAHGAIMPHSKSSGNPEFFNEIWDVVFMHYPAKRTRASGRNFLLTDRYATCGGV